MAATLQHKNSPDFIISKIYETFQQYMSIILFFFIYVNIFFTPKYHFIKIYRTLDLVNSYILYRYQFLVIPGLQGIYCLDIKIRNFRF